MVCQARTNGLDKTAANSAPPNLATTHLREGYVGPSGVSARSAPPGLSMPDQHHIALGQVIVTSPLGDLSNETFDRLSNDVGPVLLQEVAGVVEPCRWDVAQGFVPACDHGLLAEAPVLHSPHQLGWLAGQLR